MVWTTREAICQTKEKEVNPAMLGRWAYITIQGRGGISTRIYSIYCPVRSMGEKSTYKQQSRYHVARGDARCPKIIMFEDLRKSLREAAEEGSRIIIGGDINTESSAENGKS